MSVVIASKNLLIGNGDLFVAIDVSGLPSVTAYKNAYANGTAQSLPGNIGGIKGTVSLQIIREIVGFEIGVPNEIVDQTVIREGFTLKAASAELNLSILQQLIGGGTYATVTAGTTLVTDEIIVLPADVNGEPVSKGIANGPILNSLTTPSATAPVVKATTGSPPVSTGSALVVDTDYEINYVTNTIHRVKGGAIASGATIAVTYTYQVVLAETLTGGGQSAIAQVAIRYIHPYKDGRVWMVTCTKANASGSVTVGFEELGYSSPEVEFKAIADFTQVAGAHLYQMYRER